MKQTAVEWLVEEFKEKLTGNNLPNWVLDIIQQAKAMEKEQIIQSYMRNLSGGTDPRWKEIFKKQAEQYYNKTFKSE